MLLEWSGEEHPAMCGTMHILRWRPQRNGTQRAVNAVWPVGVRGHLDLIYLTDGNYWPLLGGHNLTIWLLRAIRSFIPFCEASYRLRAKYDASKSRERVGFRARLLSGRRVALASVLQYGAVSVLWDGVGLVSMTALE